eukprot:1195173-Prorocentrum_minimum.AAC.4
MAILWGAPMGAGGPFGGPLLGAHFGGNLSDFSFLETDGFPGRGEEQGSPVNGGRSGNPGSVGRRLIAFDWMHRVVLLRGGR